MVAKGTCEIDGFKLHYQIEGTGPDAIVIGSALYYSRSFSQNLRQHLRLIFVDWRGFAEITPSANLQTPTFAILLEDIDRIRQQLGIENCIIIGHSMHALLALEYAKRYSRNVSHLIMMASLLT